LNKAARLPSTACSLLELCIWYNVKIYLSIM